MEKRSTQLLRSWKRLAAELVVVFLGVYGAFWVENYRDQQDQIDRTEQVILALQQDLRDYVEVTDAFNKHVDDARGYLDEARHVIPCQTTKQHSIE